LAGFDPKQMDRGGLLCPRTSDAAGQIDAEDPSCDNALPPLATGTVAVSHDGVSAYVLDLLVRER
jgi:hypothetical protein